MSPGIKVFAPASVANIACGYDVLGMALQEPGDEIIVRLCTKPGLVITKITGANGKLPYDIERNTAGYAASELLKHLGELETGIEMEIHKKMPFGSGLGSSAASAAAAVMAINELFHRPLEKRELLPFAILGEQRADGAYHADNVAPSLLGGIILIRDNETLDFHRLPVPPGLYVTVVHPKIEILTKEARAILSDQVSLKHTIQQTGNIAAFVVGLFNSDFDLIRRSLQDVIIEPQRSKLIPGFYNVKSAAIDSGVLGCSISGAGPSIFALSNNSLIAEQAATDMQKEFKKLNIESTVHISNINHEGAVLL